MWQKWAMPAICAGMLVAAALPASQRGIDKPRTKGTFMVTRARPTRLPVSPSRLSAANIRTSPATCSTGPTT